MCSLGWKRSNMLKHMKKARFSNFSGFFAKNCQKMAIFLIFGVQFFFHTHPHYLWPTFLHLWTGSSDLKCSIMLKKYEKGSFFLFFLIFCQKLPKNGIFFHIRWSIFFDTHPHYPWPTFLQFWTGSSGLKCSNMHKNRKKARFSYFSWFFAKKLPKNGNIFHFRWSIFFSHTPSLSVTYFFYSCGLFHQV